MRNKVIYVGFAFKHHKGTHAGYHHIKEYVNYDKCIDTQLEHEWISYPKKNLFLEGFRRVYINFFAKSGTPWAIIKCIFISLFKKNITFHFVYAENSYKWLHLFKGKTNKIVCSFHQPVEYFETSEYWKNNMKSIDKIILMSYKDIDRFKCLAKDTEIKFIPHGIDSEFYSPNEKIKKSKMLLMVGNWLRDFELANKVFSELVTMDKELEICIVTSKENWSYFIEHVRIKKYSKITDQELKLLYQQAKCLFLPLFAFTANNAILEAASTNCQIFVATDNIDNSYFSEKHISFLPRNEQVITNTLLEFINVNINGYEHTKLRGHILANYAWQIVAKETINFISE